MVDASEAQARPASDCLFCKIAAGAIPSEKLHDDGTVFVIADINPQAPVHLLVIPFEHLTSVAAVGANNASLMRNMTMLANEAAKAAGVAKSGYRLVMNTGPEGGQSVAHLHMHVLGGRQLSGQMG